MNSRLLKFLPLLLLLACENSVDIRKSADTSSAPTPPPQSNSPDEPTHTPGPLQTEALSCFSSVNGGVFGSSIELDLACSSSVAEIKYCIQEGQCCDPQVSGTIYTGPITLGSMNENTCLSFFGERGESVSPVVDNSYKFDSYLPDLQLSFPKTFYQTTQLDGHHFLGSNDFGKGNFTMGEFNLKNHNPAFSGDRSCEDIFENVLALQALNPSLILNPFDMGSLSGENQIKVPLSQNDLIYGENFIASFVVNNNYETPLYSCSANKVTLMDFDFFASEASHGELGTNQVREYSGSFVAYGFFEDDMDLQRGPAGLSIDEKSDQELRIGSFGIFY